MQDFSLLIFSSAFNTIHADILLRKLSEMKVNPGLIRWYFSFLSKRPQHVRFNSVLSDRAVSSTGLAPHFCLHYTQMTVSAHSPISV